MPQKKVEVRVCQSVVQGSAAAVDGGLSWAASLVLAGWRATGRRLVHLGQAMAGTEAEVNGVQPNTPDPLAGWGTEDKEVSVSLDPPATPVEVSVNVAPPIPQDTLDRWGVVGVPMPDMPTTPQPPTTCLAGCGGNVVKEDDGEHRCQGCGWSYQPAQAAA